MVIRIDKKDLNQWILEMFKVKYITEVSHSEDRVKRLNMKINRVLRKETTMLVIYVIRTAAVRESTATRK